MCVALFDLDNTLLAGDTHYLWGCFLVEKGLVDKDYYETENLRFYEDYENGRLDIQAFLAFSLKPLADNESGFLRSLRNEFVESKIRPIMNAAGIKLIEHHRTQGHTIAIITATNQFVTSPIASAFDVEHLIATEPEFDGTSYTGRVNGIPCFREGKIEKLSNWMSNKQVDLKDSWFYSDSHNDIPLLEKVTNPVAVDPDAKLDIYARDNGWQVISLRSPAS